MNEMYRLRYEELLAEFDQYVLEHADFASQFPNQAQIVLVDERDPGFSRWSVETFGHSAQHDDVAQRPIVYVEVGKLRPRRSRLQNPRSVLPETARVLA
jgi:hypothetical protein